MFLLVAYTAAFSSGCTTAIQIWHNPPPPSLAPGELDVAKTSNLRRVAQESLRRARSAPDSAERVIWYGRAGIAQYKLTSGAVPIDRQLLRDDPTGMVAADVVEQGDDLERRHHPHLFDCTMWLRQVPEKKKTPRVRAWAAHCSFRVAEVRAYVVRSLVLPDAFDGTFAKRVRAMTAAVKRTSDAVVQAQKLALAANDHVLLTAALARLVMLYADFSAALIAVKVPAAYDADPATAAQLRGKLFEIALPIADRSRKLLQRLNRAASARELTTNPWVVAARKAVLKAPRASRLLAPKAAFSAN